MESFLNTDNLYYVKKLHIFRLRILEKSSKWDHGNGIDQESRFNVSLCYFRDISHFVVLIFWLKLEEKLYFVNL